MLNMVLVGICDLSIIVMFLVDWLSICMLVSCDFDDVIWEVICGEVCCGG